MTILDNLNAVPPSLDPATGLPIYVTYRHPTDAEKAELKAALIAVLMAECDERNPR